MLNESVGSTEQDYSLVVEYFKPIGIDAVKIPEEKGIRRTPDFKLIKDGCLIAYCELKTISDGGLEKKLEDLRSKTSLGEIYEFTRRDSTYDRIKNALDDANTQFESVNPNRDIPNIIFIISKDSGCELVDLRLVLNPRDVNPELAGTAFVKYGRKNRNHYERNLDFVIWYQQDTNKYFIRYIRASSFIEDIELFVSKKFIK